MYKLTIRMGNKGDLSGFEFGMVVGEFSHTIISRVYGENVTVCGASGGVYE